MVWPASFLRSVADFCWLGIYFCPFPDELQKRAGTAWFRSLLKIPCCLLINGGGERDRTDDPLLAKQMLSQLSYTPIGKAIYAFAMIFFFPKILSYERRASVVYFVSRSAAF